MLEEEKQMTIPEAMAEAVLMALLVGGLVGLALLKLLVSLYNEVDEQEQDFD